MIKVKVCGMTDSMNVKDISETGADFIGFIFYQDSPRYIGEEPDSGLFRNVPAGRYKTGVFVNEDPVKILTLANNYGLEMIQLHGDESPENCSQIRSSGLRIIKAFSITEDFDFIQISSYMPVCDYFLFDTKTPKYGGSGRKFSWNRLKAYNLDKPFFLSGGVGPEDADEIKAIENDGLFAVDLNSRFETAPGRKDVGLVKAFIERIRINT
jgi:phosphoribosylanthranilate isomerase